MKSSRKKTHHKGKNKNKGKPAYKGKAPEKELTSGKEKSFSKKKDDSKAKPYENKKSYGKNKADPKTKSYENEKSYGKEQTFNKEKAFDRGKPFEKKRRSSDDRSHNTRSKNKPQSRGPKSPRSGNRSSSNNRRSEKYTNDSLKPIDATKPQKPASPPKPPKPLPRITLRARRSGVHPWVFRRMLNTPEKELQPGSLVEAYSKEGDFVGRGLYNANSEITLRLLTENPNEGLDSRWFKDTIASAVAFRHDVLELDRRNTAYRVIHSEGDGLSGLVVERFGDVLVAELHCAGMYNRLPWIRDALKEQFPGMPLIVRVDARTERHEGLKMPSTELNKTPKDVVIQENGISYHVDFRTGHKTGFFLDQRDNRALVANLCKGEDVLDGCCYTGGFALSASRAGARSVEAVDLDEDAILVAQKNQKLNNLHKRNLHFIHRNIFECLRGHRTMGHTFSRIILDPAKQAIAKHETKKALTFYADLNRLAMQCLKPGGILISCSCTGLISEDDFLMSIRAGAAEAQVDMQIFNITGAAPDHPHAVRVPEGRYLKVAYARMRGKLGG